MSRMLRDSLGCHGSLDITKFGLQSCDMHFWRTIMAALCIHGALPADSPVENLSHVFQVRAARWLQ